MDKRVEAGARALARLRCERNARLDHTPRDEAFLAGAVEHAWPYWVEEATAVLAAADAIGPDDEDNNLIGDVEGRLLEDRAKNGLPLSVWPWELQALLQLARRGSGAGGVPYGFRCIKWKPSVKDLGITENLVDGLDEIELWRVVTKLIERAPVAPLRTEEEIRADERRRLAEMMEAEADRLAVLADTASGNSMSTDVSVACRSSVIAAFRSEAGMYQFAADAIRQEA